MAASTSSFRGEAPRITSRELPNNASTKAINARLQSGDLETWRAFAQTKQLDRSADIRTIYLLARQYWLSWNEEVDVARGIIPGDTTYRTYLTGLDRPRFTNVDMATGGPEPYPVQTRPVGVPSPDVAPSVAVDATQPSDTGLPLTNPGAETGTVGWTTTAGALVSYENGDIAGLNAQSGSRFFGSSAVAETEAYQQVSLGSLNVVAGQGLLLAWYQATGANGSTAGLSIRFFDAMSTLLGEVDADQIAPATPLTWERRELSAMVPDEATTARIVMRFERVGGGDLDAYVDTITLNALSYGNSFDGSSLAGWTTSPNEGSTSSDRHRMVMIDNGEGWPPPAFYMRCDERVPFFYRDFSTDRSAGMVMQFDYHETRQRGTGLHVLLFASMAGLGTSITFSSNAGVRLYGHPGWGSVGGSVEQIGTGLTTFRRYTVTLTATKTGSTSARVTVRVVDTTTDTAVVDNVQVNVPIDGPMVGFKGGPASLHNEWIIDNVAITVSPPSTEPDIVTVATAYVYTHVNDLDEESGPSPASATILKPEGSGVIVTTPTSVPTGLDDYVVVKKRLYRLATGVTGTIFRFVAEVDLDDETYTDVLTDQQLGPALETEGWELPPDDLRGILALPNGVMVGFRRNQLCFSVQNRPHAWPVGFRLTTDTDIVAIGAIDTTVVAGTESFPYVAYGSAPGSFSMAKLEFPQACVSKRGVAYLSGFGVAMPSPDGYLVFSGPGRPQNLTETIFTRKQWQALDPSSILAVAHDDVLFFFWDNGTERGGYALDMKPSGFGLVSLGFHATAAFADPITDRLYLVLDEFQSIDASGLPTPPSDPDPDGRTIFEFDGGEEPMAYAWSSKVWLLKGDAYQYFRVQAKSYDNLLARFYADGELLHQRVVESDRVYTLPTRQDYREFQFELVGTDRVYSVAASEDVDEVNALSGA